jgi:hypothetical protein
MTVLNIESINQRICDQLVRREVVYCVSVMVSEISRLGTDVGDWSYDEIIDLCVNRAQPEEALRESGYLLVDFGSDSHLVKASDKESMELLNEELLSAETVEEVDAIHEKAEELTCGVYQEDELDAACDTLGIDLTDYDREVLEHWIVSDFLAEKLRENGETVGELLGMTIWGRCTSGQAISMDWVIRKIASDMQILHGQRYAWE